MLSAVDFAEAAVAELEQRSNLRSGTAELSAELEAWSGCPAHTLRERIER